MAQPLTELTAMEQWDALLEQSRQKPVLVFKHSTTCPVSAEAYDQLEAYLTDSNPSCMYTLVKVIESRPISNRIAEQLALKHESPQAILIKDAKVAWHASHWTITANALRDALA